MKGIQWMMMMDLVDWWVGGWVAKNKAKLAGVT
jgi:hypothetical protein